MIAICEPQCQGISHENVNSGFIYGLRLAYPQEKIVFFADITQFQAIQDILENTKVLTDNIECRPIKFNPRRSFCIAGIIKYYLLFKKIFGELLSLKVDKIFFLSTNPIILYTIKKLKQQDRFKNIFCTFVLHGELEDISNVDYRDPYVPVVKNQIAISNSSGLKAGIIKLVKYRHKILPFVIKKILFVIRKILLPFFWLYSKYKLVFKIIFRVKKIIMWKHSNHYKYIVLSPHIVNNAKDYLDTDYLNFQTIIMPIVFAKPCPPANNQFIKFAVFGYGDSAQMNKMLTLLSTKKISNPYEIRIISMDRNGTDGFPNINFISNGKVLNRKEMEKYAQDIDMFINVYDNTRHKFGCSGSIFESFSYLKPVLHLSNDGYNYFNKIEKPIGFRCENLNGFVEKMVDIIDNYCSYKNDFIFFRNNILEYRLEYAIENNLNALRRSFSFDRLPKSVFPTEAPTYCSKTSRAYNAEQ